MATRVGSAFVDLKLAKLGRFGSDLKKAGARVISFGKAATKAIAIGVVGAFTLAAFAVKKFVSAAIEQERQQSKLIAVLEATGNAAGFTAEELFKEADALQKITTFGDDTIIGMQAVLATFKEIKGDAFKRAELAILDMAIVLEQDLKAGAIQVGKALNNPIKGVTALADAGVSFTEQQKEMIKVMQEAGDVAGAQAVILDELEGVFGGAAKAAGDTFGGKLIQLKNAIGDVGEQIGFALMPQLVGLIEGTKDFGAAVSNVMPQIKKGIAIVADAFRVFASGVRIGFLTAFKFVIDFKNNFVTIMKGLAENAFIFGKNLFGFIGNALKNSFQFFKNFFENVKRGFKALIESIATQSLKPFQDLVFKSLTEGVKGFVAEPFKDIKIVESVASKALGQVAGEEKKKFREFIEGFGDVPEEAKKPKRRAPTGAQEEQKKSKEQKAGTKGLTALFDQIQKDIISGDIPRRQLFVVAKQQLKEQEKSTKAIRAVAEALEAAPMGQQVALVGP